VRCQPIYLNGERKDALRITTRVSHLWNNLNVTCGGSILSLIAKSAMTQFDSQKHHRRSIRLKGYDYSQAGAYFVTMCVQNRECALGEVVDGEMRYSSNGYIVRDFWPEVEAHFPHVEVASFVIMPNHVHAMIIIRDVAPSEGDQSDMRRGVVPTRRGVVPTRRGVVPTPLRTTHPQSTSSQSTPLHAAAQSDPGRGNPVSTGGKPDLGHIVAFYKYQTTKRINAQSRRRDDHATTTPGRRFWQRNYYEHIIRDEADLRRIVEYIRENPRRWEDDQLHPQATPNRFNRDKSQSG